MMNKTEATHVIILLCWLLNQPGPDGRHHSGSDAAYAASRLAERAHQALGVGLTAAHTENLFENKQPIPVAQPAYVYPFHPGAVREYFADCWDCEDGDKHDCTKQQVTELTDDQLTWAAQKVLGGANPLDEGIESMMDMIVSLAQWPEKPSQKLPAVSG